VIDADALRTIPLATWAMGAEVTATVTGGTGASTSFAAEGLRPLPPVNLVAGIAVDGELELQWTRRSREGFAWVDEIDAPLGEAQEQYRIAIAGSMSSPEWLTDRPTLTVPADRLAEIGSGPAVVAVRQIGDFATSRPAQLTINLP